MSHDDNELWMSFASDAAEAIRGIEESLLELEGDPANPEEINRLYRGLHTLKGNSGFLSLSSIEGLTHACEDLIGLVRDGGQALDDEMINLCLAVLDRLRGALGDVCAERRDVAPERLADIRAQVQRMYAERGGNTRARAAMPAVGFFDDLPADASFFDVIPPSPAPSETVATPPVRSDAPAAAKRAERAEFLRVDPAKAASLMDLAGEIGLACAAVTRHPALEGLDVEGFSAAAHRLELLIQEMQNDVAALRLVPVAGTFQRMRRVVRDAAQRTGKRVEFEVEGEDTEVDKVMLDALHDPLVHVLRNAVDHGLETPEQRAAAGKSPTGRIVISATHQSGEVTIEVRDDGRGLDRDALVAKARARGLLAPGAEPTPDEAARLIFLPGFSTKEQADALSGRGVGMDVVKTTIESMRGHVALQSVPGRGMRLTMTLPLTLAFVDAMVVRESGRLFALPIERVFEVCRIAPAAVVKNAVDGRSMLRVRDEIVPVLWLRDYWGEAGEPVPPLSGRVAVIVQTRRGSVALPVDELLGNQQIMLKPLRGVLSTMRGASSCGMLGSGDVAVALDCERLVA